MCLTLLPIMAEVDNSDLSVCYRTVVIIIIDATTKRSRERVDISDFLPLLRLLLLLRRRRRFPIFPLSVVHPSRTCNQQDIPRTFDAVAAQRQPSQNNYNQDEFF
jgi:hypothetical protein